MGWGTTAPAAVSGIVAALASLNDADTTVIKYVKVGSDPWAAAVIVGGDDQGGAAVQTRNGMSDAGLAQQRETYAVNCLILVKTGSTDVDLFLDRPIQLLNAVGAALQADHTLGGAVMMAQIGAWALDLTELSNGGNARLPFEVNVTASTIA